MRLSKVLLTFAAASMMATPVAATAATANPAAKLSISKSVPGSARASSKSGKSKAIGGGIFILIIAFVAIGAGIAAGVSGDSTPDSN